jgi:hypothetical protein
MHHTNKTNNRATFGSVKPMIPFFLCYYYKKKNGRGMDSLGENESLHSDI